MSDSVQQEPAGTAVDFTNVYIWRDAGGNAYYVKGILTFQAKVELVERSGPAEGPIVFDVIAYPHEDGTTPTADPEFVAWASTRPQVEVEIHGHTRTWRSATDKAEPWSPRIEPLPGASSEAP